MADKTRIVIVGGGYAGVQVAKTLYKEFKRDTNIEITLIDKHPYHTLMTDLHEVAGSRVEPDAVMVSFHRIFAGKRIQVVLDTVTQIDFETKKVIGTQGTYEYDYVVIGSGAEPEFFGITGVQENSYTLWSFEDALKLREQINMMFLKASEEADPEKRKELLTFVVAGAGFTGIEMAGELLEHRDTMCRKYHIKREEVSIIIVEALSMILTMLHEDMRAKAMKYLEKKGAKVMLNSPIIGASEGEVYIKGGNVIRTKTFIWTCGVM
ncbi:MAG TPA: FAD-dependent oxidoreductase, partial [Spirochaetia bacterium]|nr:FAD-dependent oxidoreductase [Spirochaetia bacterium]